MAQFLIMGALAVLPGREDGKEVKGVKLVCDAESRRRSALVGFEILKQRGVQLKLSFRIALEIYGYLSLDGMEILTDTILDILVVKHQTECRNTTRSDYDVEELDSPADLDYRALTKFLADNPEETYRCIISLLQCHRTSNLQPIIHELLRYRHHYGRNPLNDLNDVKHIHRLNMLVMTGRSFSDSFTPCSAIHVERILLGLESKAVTWRSLLRTTLICLFEGIVAPTRRVLNDWYSRGQKLGICDCFPAKIPLVPNK